MTSTVKALQNLYVAKGGELTDTYATIAGGTTVANLVTIPDLINALAELETANTNKETEENTESE